MNLIGLLPVRSEDWCLGLTARAALRFCDSLIILDHASTDRTPAILDEIEREHPGRIIRMHDPDPKWEEMRHRDMMLDRARFAGATHLWLGDADEILSGDLLPTIRGLVERMHRGTILTLPGYNLRGGIRKYHRDGIWGFRWFSVAFVDDPVLSWSGDRFHSREPGGLRLQPYRPIQQFAGGCLHLWGASERRLIAKHALYKCVEVLRWPNKSRAEIDRTYSWAIHGQANHPSFGTPKTWSYADVPDKWLAPYADMLTHLHVDAEPWQISKVRQLVAQHGRERFHGLDLFGVEDPHW